MRKNGDHRPTAQIKIETYNQLNPAIILDDEPSVVDLASKAGYHVLQVVGYRISDRDQIPFKEISNG